MAIATTSTEATLTMRGKELKKNVLPLKRDGLFASSVFKIQAKRNE